MKKESFSKCARKFFSNRTPQLSVFRPWSVWKNLESGIIRFMQFTYKDTEGLIILEDGRELQLSSPQAFELISEAWVRSGWDTKYVYGFTWMGRPVIQLPEDLIRIQEVIYDVQPDVIIETGVAHGGSLVFYAGLMMAMGKGKVVGVDIEIRPKNRSEIEKHPTSEKISLIEGNSVSDEIVAQVGSHISSGDKVLVVLDSNHSLEHVQREIEIYSEFVSQGSYIVVCDGIMAALAGAPRSSPDWKWNNPLTAIDNFLQVSTKFTQIEPPRRFNEGLIKDRVTYWPNAFLKRVR